MLMKSPTQTSAPHWSRVRQRPAVPACEPQKCGIQNRHQLIVPVEKHQLWKLLQVTNAAVIRGKVLGARQPADVRPDESAHL